MGLLMAQGQILTISQAIGLALDSSYDAHIANNNVAIAKDELQMAKNLRYPDFKITAQYDYLTNPNLDIRIPTNSDNEGSSSPAPEVHNLFLGQASLSLPVFTGGKLKNTINRSENMYQAAVYESKSDQEQLALQVVNSYVNLYNARKTVELMQDNLSSAEQRVKDFTGMEKNGLLARNDLLKAQLQASNVELSLDEAKKSEHILQFQLLTLLKLPDSTLLNLEDSDFGSIENSDPNDVATRNDIKTLRYQQQAALNAVKVAKGKYYPSISLVAGYVALNIENLVTVENAMNFGLGFSYNIADIFKAKSDVHAAEGRALNIKYTLAKAQDQANIQIENARESYKLAIKKFNVYTLSQEQAIENYRIVNNKYKNGLVDTNDLLNADVQQLRSKVNLATAGANITQKYYELLAAEGKLLNGISK